MRLWRAALVTLLCALAGSRVQGEAPTGYVMNEANGVGYRLVYQAQTWPVARDKCTDDGATLAVPKTMEEFSFIQKLVRGMHYPSVVDSKHQMIVWLGINNLDDYRVWRNVDGENIEESEFHKWADGNGHGFSDAPEEPHCAGVAAVNWLRDYWCHRRQPYLCQIYMPTNNKL